MARRAGPRSGHRRRTGARPSWARAGVVLGAAGALFAAGLGVGAWVAGPRPLAAPPAASASPIPSRPVPVLTAPPAPVQRGSQAAAAVPLPRLEPATPAAITPVAVTPAPADALPRRVDPVPRQAGPMPAWQRYAAAAEPANGRPMIAIVLDDLGIDRRRAGRAIELPATLTLAFLPYARDLAEQAAAARARGHELLVHLPMQPHGQDSDPGPNVLDIELGPAEVRDRIEWSLRQFEGYVGVNNHMGSRFTESAEGMGLVAEAMRAHGLLFLDSLTSAKSVGERTARSRGVPTTRRDVFLDNTDTAAEVEIRLAQVERMARETGSAIAIGHPRDATLNVLEAWIPKARAAGFVLVPLTAVIQARDGSAGADGQHALRP